MAHFVSGPKIKFRFLILRDTSGRVGKFFLSRAEAEKLAGSGGKKSNEYLQGNGFYGLNKKKTLFILPLPTSSEKNNDFLAFVGSVGSIF